MKQVSVFLWCAVILFSAAGDLFAEGLSSVGVLSGYMTGDLKTQDDYEVIPFMVSFGFDAKPLAEKIGIHTEGILEFQVEPFLSPALEPEKNLETGINLLLKYGFPLSEQLVPYIKFGAGPSYMTLHTYEQGTQFNFVDSAGAGLSFKIKDRMYFDCEYRFRHLSNCSIDDRNGGINTHTILGGFSYRFQ